MASLDNIFTVALLEQGASFAKDNMNVCCIMTSTLGVLSSSNRTKAYGSSAEVAEDFGSTSEEAKFANVFFAQSPNPINAGGVLVLGYWRAVDETVSATAGTLSGEQVTEDAIIPLLQSVSDGSFDITIDGSTEAITGLDLRTVTSFDDVLTLLNAEITGATVTYSNAKFIVTSDTTGVTSTMTYATAGTAGTFIGGTLGLDANSSSVLVQGADAVVLSAEEKVAGVTACKSEVNFKGFCFIGATTDQESLDLATWSQGNATLGYDVFTALSNLEINVTNPVWQIKLASQVNYRMSHSKAGNRTLACGIMSRAHTVNFDAENSALTMNLKEIKSVVAEAYSQDEINKAQKVGLDILTTFKNVPKLWVSGANGQIDNVYNLMAYVDSVQVTASNTLGTTATKIPQTTAGVNALITDLEKDSQRFVRAGVFARGTWTLSDTFGDLESFHAGIEDKGFYWYAPPLSLQSNADREARKTPVLQNAVKNAGAFHSGAIIINWNI